jgi:hypothetical protein
VIFEKFRKKNVEFGLYMTKKILVSKFNFRLKEEIPTIPCVLHLQSSQANSVLTRAGPYHKAYWNGAVIGLMTLMRLVSGLSLSPSQFFA